MKLTIKQILLLDDVFSYALHLLESKDFKEGWGIGINKHDDACLIDWNEEHKKIIELAEVIRPQIEVIEDEQETSEEETEKI